MPNYTSLEEMKSRIGSMTDDLDVVLGLAIAAAETAVEDHCGERPFTADAAASARVFIPRGGHVFVDDISSLTGLVIADTGQTYASSAYQLEPLNALAKGRPYEGIRLLGSSFISTSYDQATVTVTARWGWPAVPTAVKEATRILAADLFHLKDNQFGVAGFGEMGVLMVRENSYVKTMLKNYRRAFAMR